MAVGSGKSLGFGRREKRGSRRGAYMQVRADMKQGIVLPTW